MLTWYHRNCRDLPWRRTDDPYAILVSEIMLQQTRVEAVIGYYTRFLARFPDIRTLADAPEAELLKLWEGLGYYSRARNLQKTARVVMRQYDGKLPGTAEALLTLPGIGAYTAGAVASIAFGQAVLAVDGNVKRVGARLLGIRQTMESREALCMLETALQAAQPGDAPGDFNQALMELGATVCLPRTPRCAQCPIRDACDAFAEGDAEQLPIRMPRKTAQTVGVAVALLTAGGRVLTFRRSQRLLHGLRVFWLYEGESTPEALRQNLLEEGIQPDAIQDAGQARHVFTHRIWDMRLYQVPLTHMPTADWLEAHDAVAASAEDLAAMPFPTAMKAALQYALQYLKQEPFR